MTPSRFDREPKAVWYLPDGRLAIVAAETPADRCRLEDFDSLCTIFVADADGGNPQMLEDSATLAALSFDPSPDGTEILYVRWADGEPGRLHVLDIASGDDREVVIDNQDPIENINEAWYSPDGSQILFDRYEADGEHWAVVPSAGGDAVNIGRRWDRRKAPAPKPGSRRMGGRCWRSMRRRPMGPANSGSDPPARDRTASSRHPRTTPRSSSGWRPSDPSSGRRPGLLVGVRLDGRHRHGRKRAPALPPDAAATRGVR